MDFPTREVREGCASVLVPDSPVLKGPGRRTALPFYNPAMRVSRDMTVAALSSWLPSPATVLDGLAATGVLGIRTALEAGRVGLHVTWNDLNPRARELIVENTRRNGVDGVIMRDDLRRVLVTHQYSYVDIDPFGPPVRFVDLAVQQASTGSALGIGATDTAPLAGTYPATCLRRYGARSLRNPCGHETALRIFLGYLVRVAAVHERGLRPLVAFAAEHFVKAIVAVEARVSAAESCLAQLGYVQFEGAHFEVSKSAPSGPHAGPMWLGPLAEPDLLTTMLSRTETSYSATRILAQLREEVGLPPMFYENHAVAQTLHVDPVPVAAWIDALRSAGFRASRTYFTANAARTDAPWEEVVRIYRHVQAANR